MAWRQLWNASTICSQSYPDLHVDHDHGPLDAGRSMVRDAHLHVISDFQKLFLTPDPNQLLIPRHPVPREGALAIVTDVGAGSGGREGCD
jgi:hypothetical protein